jgi:hypothetical protein
MKERNAKESKSICRAVKKYQNNNKVAGADSIAAELLKKVAPSW